MAPPLPARGGEQDALDPTTANVSNPRGYWQNRAVMMFNAQLERDIGLPYWDPAFRDRARALADSPRHRDGARALVAQMQDAGRPWFWKEPMFTMLLRFWKEIWRDPIYIVTVRHPYASALSWEKYFVPPHERGKIRLIATTLSSWQCMMTSVLEDTVDSPSRSLVVYEHLIADPEPACRRLADFLSRETGTAPVSDAHLLTMTAAIDPALRHVRVPAAFDEEASATQAQKALYRFLLARAADPALAFDAGRYPFCPGWREHLDNLEILKALYVQLYPSEAAVQPFGAGAI